MVVDVHTHFIPRFIVEEGPGAAFGVREEDGLLVHPQGFRYPLAPEFLDSAAKIADMDRSGIDVAVLSSAPTLFFYEKEADSAVAFARRSNDALAGIVAEEPRFAGLATLPLQSPADAVAELRRAVTELGLRGAQIGANCGAMQLDHPSLEPVFTEAAELDVPLMIHPYYVGPKPGLEDYYLTNSVGNPLDTCVAAVRIIHCGLLDRLPALELVLVHAGGFLPYQVGRFDHSWTVRLEPKARLSRPPGEYLDRFVFDTIAHHDAALAFLADLVGPDRLVLGTDLPFDMGDPVPLERVRRAGLDPGALGANASTLLGLDLVREAA